MTTEVEKPPSLPKYPEMILEAISQEPKEGVNKSAISKYIESKFGDVPAGHANLLTTHLTRMKDEGEIVFFKNNYLLPDPAGPPKRGRGRPPKAKDPAAETAEKVAAPPTSARGRGRPRKDPNAEPAPKKPKPAAPAATPEVGSNPAKRGRGRPKKVIQVPVAAAAVAPSGSGV